MGECIEISPEVIISWGVNATTPGAPTMERRVVERSCEQGGRLVQWPSGFAGVGTRCEFDDASE